ncbi:MAG: hypothetical protein M5U09_06290 [Gammaproteobacteria bacterium]|nr:hypothetical protein [Gammaproteobacteria bacterium]
MNSKLPGRRAVDAWARLARAYLTLHGRIEAALKAEGLPPLAWYDVLIEVHRAREAGIRQFEIGKRPCSPSTISRACSTGWSRRVCWRARNARRTAAVMSW